MVHRAKLPTEYEISQLPAIAALDILHRALAVTTNAVLADFGNLHYDDLREEWTARDRAARKVLFVIRDLSAAIDDFQRLNARRET